MIPDPSSWIHETISTNGLNFHMVSQGEGPVVLMLHGFPENWYSWRHQLSALAQHGYKAVAMDMRGYNLTDRPTRVSDYRMPLLVADVEGLISALGCEKVHLVGHDWGGVVAWTFGARHPERLLSLTILNSPHPKAFAWHLKHNFRQLRRSWYMFFFQIPILPELLIRLAADQTFVRTFRGWAIHKEMFSDDVIDFFKKPMLQPGALTAGINYYRAMLRNVKTLNEAQQFPKISVPTQVIWGENDRALGKELCDGLEDYFENHFELHFIPNCSHWVQQEEPDKVNELLVDFFKRVA